MSRFGNASFRPDFQRTKQSFANDFKNWRLLATDPAFHATSIDALEARYGGRGGLSRKEIEYGYTIERQSRERRAAGVVA